MQPFFLHFFQSLSNLLIFVYMNKDQDLHSIIQEAISSIEYPQTAKNLFAPIQYTLSMGGKRIRPLLTLMSTKLFGGDIEKAITPAIGIETFHNFTLLHDDLMDNADMRRNNPTVHKKWDANTAILSGDAMQIMAYQMIAKAPAANLEQAISLFSNTAIEICEGQQYDMEFETRDDVSKDEYIEMIRLKTAVLLGCALKMGAIIAGADYKDAELIYTFGEKIGLAFQLKDDLLDTYADEAKFGKRIGGDILNNKKTYLMLSALEASSEVQLKEAMSWMSLTDYVDQDKISFFVDLYNKTNAAKQCEDLMDLYYKQGMEALKAINVEEASKNELYTLANNLMYREL